MRRNWPRLAILAALTVLVAGCGGTSAHVGSTRTLDVALSEYRINPRNVTTSPGIVTLIVRNYGRLTHKLVIAQDGRPQGATLPIAPGTEATLVVYLFPGDYTMSSTLLEDADLGARGTLTVS